MTDLDDITADIEAGRAEHRARLAARVMLSDASRHALANTCYRWLADAAAVDALAVTCACDAILQGLRGRLPEPAFSAAAPFFTGADHEARMWTEFASDGQLAAMLGAIFDRLSEGRPIAMSDRKRLLVAVWNSLPADDKRAFAARISKEKDGQGRA